MVKSSQPEDAVVIGMGCRFPGSATSPSKLWDMLAKKESGWSSITRFNAEGFYHPDPKRQGAINVQGAHFLQHDPAAFDAPFFSIPAASARSMDPQQRLLLELTYEALEDAGITMEEIKGSRTSVFIASFVKDYELISMRDMEFQPEFSSIGNGTAIMSNRISYVFDLKGPSVTIDTACSGSLVAMDLAIQSLESGSADMAIVGGVNMIMCPDTMFPMTSMGFLSAEGKCFTFDSGASGYGRGEGAGIVVLKRASDARIHNDPIRAVVVGHGVNQDGRTSGITMPNPESQAVNIRDVYSKSSLNYNDTAYVECHGTGTVVGDKFETLAISNAIQSQRSVRLPLVVGSVKTNIGHLEAAAGVAGFIKAVLTVEKGKILPNINFSSPRQDFSMEDLGLEIPFETMDWPQGYTKRQASVNSFGFGGTNAHVVLQDASDLSLPLTPPPEPVLYSSSSVPQPFVFSARDSASLQRMLARMDQHIETLPSDIPSSYFENLAYTMGARRSKLDTRISISADSLSSLQASLRGAKETDFVTSPSSNPRVCFIFSGQGSVWPQMGENLRCFKVYQDSIAASNDYFRSTYQWDGDIEAILNAPKAESQVSDVHFSQIINTTIQIACLDLFASLGIKAEYALGHSSGEIAAAYAARKITKQFALSCAFLRGLTIKRFLAEHTEIGGGMISVGMAEEEAQAFLNRLELNPKHIVVACINSPRSVTISGRAAEISIAAAELKRLGTFHRVLQIPIGYHSPDMEVVQSFYNASLVSGILSSIDSATLPFSSLEVAEAPIMYSSLFSCEMDKMPLDAAYWPQNLTQPVQFNGALRAMMTNGKPQPTVFVEVGTGGGMRTPVLDSVAPYVTGKKKPTYLSLLSHTQSSEMFVVQRLGEMWNLGLPVNITNVITRTSSHNSLRCLNDLPTYPWDHNNKYWYESRLSKSYMSREKPRRDLIGSKSLESTPYNLKWRSFHRLSENPWIRDHKVQGAILYPAAGMIAMAIEAGVDISSKMQNITAYEITDFVIHQAMVVPDGVYGLESTLSMRRILHNDETAWAFEICSRDNSGPFQRNATGTLCLVSDSQSMNSFLSEQSLRIQESATSCTEEASTIELYETLDSIGLSYGPTFCNVTDIRRNSSHTFASVKTPDTKSCMPHGFEFDHVIHPATLDSMLHTLFTPESQPMVPVGIEKIVISASLRGGSAGTPFYGFGQITSQGVRESRGNLAMTLSLDEKPQVVLSGIRLAALQFPQNLLRNYRHLGTEVVWKEDISMSRPTQGQTLQDVLENLTFKKPVLSVLMIGWSTTQSPLLLAEFARPGMNITLTLQKHLSCDIDEDALNKSGLSYKIVEMFGTGIATGYDLIFACNQDGLNIASLQSRLYAHGVMILPSPLKLSIPHLSSDHPGVDKNNASSVSCFGVSSTILFAARSKDFDSPIAILLPTNCPHFVMSLGTTIRGLFLEQGHSATLVEMPVDEISKMEIKGSKCISLMHLTKDENLWTQPENISVIKQLKTLASGLFFVTCPSLSNGMYGSQITGLVRTLISENMGLALGTVRLSTSADFTSVETASLIKDAATQVFSSPEVKDVEFEARDSALFIPRLQLLKDVNEILDPTLQTPTQVKFFNSVAQQQPTLNCRKMTGEANNLFWSHLPPPVPGPGEVLLQRQAMLISVADSQYDKGISSFDSSALPALGRDFFGFFTSENGTSRKRVVGLIRPQAISKHVVANELLIEPVSESLQYFSLSAYVSAVAAFCAPIPVMEALTQSDLERLLSRSELPVHDKTVLVVGAASVEGQAAVEVAAAYGYTVYCCVQDSSEMEIMANLGIPNNRIMTLDSQGMPSVKKFSMVYAVSGFSVPNTVKCCALFELVNAHSQSFASHIKKTSHFLWDMDALLEDDVPLLSQMIKVVQHLSSTNRIHMSYAGPIHEAATIEEGLRHYDPKTDMVVVPFNQDFTVAVENFTAIPRLSSRIEARGIYVIVGSPRGLSGSIGHLLAQNGARNLAFISRSAGYHPDDNKLSAKLEAMGVTVKLIPVDLTNSTHVSSVAASLMQFPGSVKGIVQCAGVLQDSVFDKMTQEQWDAAIRPKVNGTQNLVAAFAGSSGDPASLPWVLMLSSAAGIVGNRGQANYAAANTWQDAFARELRSRGIVASSVALGPIMGPGMISRNPAVMQALKAGGFFGIRHSDFLKIVGSAIARGAEGPANSVYGVGTGGLIRQMKTTDPYWLHTAIFSHLALVDNTDDDQNGTGDADDSGTREKLDVESVESVQHAISNALAVRLEMAPGSIDVDKSMLSYGLDSFNGFWLRKWVEDNTGVQVLVFEIIGDVTLAALAQTIVTRYHEKAKADV